MNTLVASVLNKVLGDWLEGIDQDSLESSIYDGTVHLGPVSLRQDALDQFGFPFVIRQGFVNKVFVSVPWTSLFHKPMRLEIEGVSLYLSPRPKSQWSPEVEIENARKVKKHKLANYELSTITPTEPDSPSYINTSVDNLQVSISGVYIRYEDTESAAAPFSIGLILQKLLAVSCNREWIEGFVTDSEIKYKKVAVESFSVFLDYGSNCKPALHFGSEESDKQEFRRFARRETEQDFPFPHKFLLSPVNLTANFEINQNSANRTIPQVVLNLVLGDRVHPLKCGFETPQATCILKMTQFWQEFENFQRGVLNSYKFPDFSSSDASDYREKYTNYKRLIESNKRKQATLLYPQLSVYESNHSLADIILMRQLATIDTKLAVEEQKAVEELQKLTAQGEGGGTFLGSVKALIRIGDSDRKRQEKEVDRKTRIETETARLGEIRGKRREIMEDPKGGVARTVGEMKGEDAGYVRFQVALRVPEYTFDLLGSRSPLLRFWMNHFVIELSLRATLTFSLRLQLNKFLLKDEVSNSAIYPNLAESGRIQLSLDKTVMDTTKVAVPMCEQLMFVGNLETISAVVSEVSKAVKDISDFGKYQRVVLASVDKYVALGKQFTSEVVQSQYHHHSFDINIDLTAPCFFIPLRIDQPGDVLTLDLGKVKVSTLLAKQSRNLQSADDQSSLPPEIYDRIRIELDQIEAATLHSFESLSKWRKGTSEVLFKPSKVVVDLRVNVEDEDEMYPGLVGEVDMGEAAITVSDGQLGMLMNLRQKVREIVEVVVPRAEEQNQTFILKPSSESSSPPSALSTHFHVRLRELSATLIQSSTAIFQLKFQHNFFTLSCTPSGNLVADFRIKSLSAEDLRSDTQWRKMLARPSTPAATEVSLENTRAKLVGETLSSHPTIQQLHQSATSPDPDCDFRFFLSVIPSTSSLTCLCAFNELRFIVNHETLVTLLAFPRDFIPVLTAARPTLESIESKLMRTPRPSFLAEEEKVEPEVPRDFKFVLILKRLEVWIPLEPRAQGSKLLGAYLEGSFLLSSKQRPRIAAHSAEIDETGTIDISKIGASLGYVSEGKITNNGAEKDDILKPFRFSLLSTRGLHLSKLTTHIDALLETFDLTLTLRDLLFLQDLRSRFHPVFHHSSILPPSASVLAPVIMPDSASRVYHVSLKCEYIQIFLSDDSLIRKPIPILTVTISNLSAEGSTAGREISIDLAGAVETQYFNTYAGAWEPLIEFWPFDVVFAPAKVTESDQSKRRLRFRDMSVLDITAKSDRPLKANLSYAMVKTWANIREKLTGKRGDFKEDSGAVVTRQAPSTGGIKIKNRCGVLFEVWLEGNSATEDQQHFQLDHRAEQIIPRETIDAALGRKQAYRSLLQTPLLPVRIGLQLPDMLPVRYLSIGAPGRYAYNTSKKDAEHLGIFLEIRRKPDWTVVVIESKLKIANNCPFAVTIERDGDTRAIRSMEVASVPCTWLVRPNKIMLQTTSGTVIQLLEAYGMIRMDRNLNMVVDHAWVSKFGETGERPHLLQHLILLNPPLTVINCFPAKLIVTHVGTGIETVVEAGMEAAIFHVNFEGENAFRWKVVMGTGETSSKAEVVGYTSGVVHYRMEGDLPSDKLTLEAMTSHKYNHCPSLDLPSLTLSRESFHGLLLHAFSQYWIVNHTDYFLEFTGKKGGLSVPSRSSGMVKCGKKALRMRVKERKDAPLSDWSEPFNITSKGVAGLLTVQYPLGTVKNSGRVQVKFGVLLSAGTWPVVKSTIIQVYPRYVVTSSLPFPVFMKQKQGGKVVEINKGQSYAYQFEDGVWDKHVHIGIDRSHWSTPFSIDEIESFQVRFLCQSICGEDWWRPSALNEFHLYVHITISTENQATIFIHFSPPTDAEILVQNEAKVPVELRQEGCEHTTFVNGGQTVPFAYDNHLAAVKRVELRIPDYCSFYNFDKIKTFKTLLGRMEVAVEPNGNTRVVVIRDKAVYGYTPTVSVVVQAANRARNFNISLGIPSIEWSLHDEHQREMFLITLTEVFVHVEQRWGILDGVEYRKEAVGGSVGKVQVDNMRAGRSQFPVVFGCKDAEERTEDTGVPFAQAQFVIDSISRPSPEHSLDFHRVEYIGIQLQEMFINVHQDTVEELIAMIWKVGALFEKGEKEGNMGKKLEEMCSELTPMDPGSGGKAGDAASKTFYQSVNLAAMKVTISLKTSADSDPRPDRSPSSDLLRFLCRFSSALTNISDSPLNFNAIIVLNSFQTLGSMMKVIQQRYWSQGLLQFYKLLGSADVIGNPLGLIDKLGTGVFEFFSQPVKGLMKSPEDFAQGVGKGVKSLVTGIVSGSAGSVSKITGSLYTFVRTVGGDKPDLQPSPDTVAEGLIEGVKGGFVNLTEGVTGIFVKPWRGARTGGVTGFIKGVGTGVVGVVVAPFAAVLRVGASVTSSVATQASTLSGWVKPMGRARFPRQIGAKRVIETYHYGVAQAQALLRSIPGEVNGNVTFFTEISEDAVVLLTEKELIYIKAGEVSSLFPLHKLDRVELRASNRGFFVFLVSDHSPLRIRSESFQLLARLYMALGAFKGRTVNSSLV